MKVTITKNEKADRLDLVFDPPKPCNDIRTVLKQNGCTWHKYDRCWIRSRYTESVKNELCAYFKTIGVEIFDATISEIKQRKEYRKVDMSSINTPSEKEGQHTIHNLYFNGWKIRVMKQKDRYPEFNAEDVMRILDPTAGYINMINAVDAFCIQDGLTHHAIGDGELMLFVNEENLFLLVSKLKPALKYPLQNWIAKNFRLSKKQEEQPLIVPDILPVDFVFENANGELVTTSLIVAKVFEKYHHHVLRDIKNLNCSPEFYETNFGCIEDQAPTHSPVVKHVYYEIKKDGFSFLVMGYTGEKAGKFKEDFIKEFNRMEQLVISMKESQQVVLPNFKNPAEAARAWADQFERAEISEAKNKELAPAAEFGKSVMASPTTIPLNILSKMASDKGYDIGLTRLCKWMREKGYLCKSERLNNIPVQREVNDGFLGTTYEMVLGKLIPVAMVTQKGVRKYLHQIMAEFPKRKNWIDDNHPKLF